MTLTEHARLTLRRQIEKLESQLALALQDPGEDPVHDFRVAIRRLSQSFRIFATLFPQRDARRYRHALKPAMDAAAIVRDLDVDADLLRKLGLPDSHPLLARMQADRQRAAFAFTGQLYLLRAQDLPTSWLQPADLLVETAEDAPTIARTILPDLAADFFKAGRKTTLRAAAPERLHSFRLVAKRFRYTLEVFRPFYGPVFDQRVQQVREIQSILGRRQDCAVTAAILQPLAPVDLALQQALDAVSARAVRLDGEFLVYWNSHFDAEGQELLWTRYLSRHTPVRRSSTSTTK